MSDSRRLAGCHSVFNGGDTTKTRGEKSKNVVVRGAALNSNLPGRPPSDCRHHGIRHRLSVTHTLTRRYSECTADIMSKRKAAVALLSNDQAAAEFDKSSQASISASSTASTTKRPSKTVAASDSSASCSSSSSSVSASSASSSFDAGDDRSPYRYSPSNCPFSGFGAALPQFFAALATNNNRDWWNAHKAEFARVVTAPMQRLAAALEPEFGPIKVFRPYRDLRFGTDKRPVKEFASLVTRDGDGDEDGGGEPAYPCYMQIDANEVMVAGGLWEPPAAVLAAFRASLERREFVAAVHAELNELKELGFTLSTEGGKLASAPRGYKIDHPQIELLRYKSLAVARVYPLRAPDASVGSAPLPAMVGGEFIVELVAGWRVVRRWSAWLRANVPGV
jgi:uncharacterized protein (TIGR02453 family)